MKFEGLPAWEDVNATEGALAGSGMETRLIEFEAKEHKLEGYIDNPRGLQKGKILFARTASRIYRVMAFCDKESYADYKDELDEILQSFSVTGG